MMGSPASIAIFPNQGQPPEPPDAEAASEKRNAARYPASDIPSITGLRLSPHGAEASLVNLSTTGLLAECAVRLKTGSTVTVQFEGTFTPAAVQGRVARCSVARVSNTGTLLYHVGLAFDEAMQLPAELERAAAVTAETPAPVAAVPQTAEAPPVETPAADPAPPAVEHVRPTLRNRW